MLQNMQTCPRQRWLQEALLFLGFFTLNSMTSWELLNSGYPIAQEFAYFCLLYGHAQIQRFFVLPHLLDGRQVRRYAGISVGILLLFSVILMQFNAWLCTEKAVRDFSLVMIYLYAVACATVSLLLFNVPLLVHRFYEQRQQQESFSLCMKEMELSTLRSQLNPHFLFNTLNNLYGISLHEPGRTPDLIMQLSQLLRYQLDSTRQMWVPLADELLFLESYVALEMERVGSRCRVNFSGLTHPTDNYVVAPMMLMPFVENAFKHGTAGIGLCEVNISIKLADEKLHLRVSNSVPRRAKAPISTGVGLENTRQRLEMLYPDTHQLIIRSWPDNHVVDLIIPLQPCFKPQPVSVEMNEVPAEQ
ncbi:hypothetical protein GCM10027592_28910 [Spirosoma flavus]